MVQTVTNVLLCSCKIYENKHLFLPYVEKNMLFGGDPDKRESYLGWFANRLAAMNRFSFLSSFIMTAININETVIKKIVS